MLAQPAALLAPTTRSEFPDPNRAPADGLLARSDEMGTERLIDAYSHGIFPWFDRDDRQVLWWSPNPRAVIKPARLRISRSLAKRLRSRCYEVTADRAFAETVAGCAAPRRNQQGTWITPRMAKAYAGLYQIGLAHSVEVWRNDALVGGIYGVSLGRMFFGESMFSRARDASKVALAHLAAQLAAWRFTLIDCQMMTDHLRSLGAAPIPRGQFLRLVAANRQAPTLQGPWRLRAPPAECSPSPPSRSERQRGASNGTR